MWDRVDLPVLEWVAEAAYDLRWRFDRGKPTDELPELSGDEVDAALRRLEDHGLVAKLERVETIGFFEWIRLRPTADGLRVLGEWPPTEEADMGAALVVLLRSLAAEEAEPRQ